MSLMRWLFGGERDVERTRALSGLEAVERVILPAGCAERTQSHLRAAGREGNEGFVVWSGVQDGSVFHVRTVTAPEQRAIRSANGVCVVVDEAALHRLNVWLHRNGERLIAQVHSHPTDAYHSDMDDDYAVATTVGSLSLVVPNFAVRPFSLAECAVYRLAADGRWSEIPAKKVAALISLTDGA